MIGKILLICGGKKEAKNMQKHLVAKITDERNYGIDLLRLISMFMVVCLHVIGHGGVLVASKDVGQVNYVAAQFLESISLPAVDCFAIITGYVSYGKTFRLSRYLKVWIQASFISFSCVFILFLFGHDVGLGTVVFSALPVFWGRNWYIVAYTGLCFLIPMIDSFEKTVDENVFDRMLCLGLVGISIYGTVSNVLIGTVLIGVGGYSYGWLAMLYMLGLWLRKNQEKRIKIKASLFMLILVVSVLVTWIPQFIDRFGNIQIAFCDYTSPCVVLQAIAWVCISEKIKVSHWGVRIIRFLAPSALSVYLIHDNPMVRDIFIQDKFLWFAKESVFLEVVLVYGAAFTIFVCCIILDVIIRRPIFRLIKVNQIIDFCCRK